MMFPDQTCATVLDIHADHFHLICDLCAFLKVLLSVHAYTHQQKDKPYE